MERLGWPGLFGEFTGAVSGPPDAAPLYGGVVLIRFLPGLLWLGCGASEPEIPKGEWANIAPAPVEEVVTG